MCEIKFRVWDSKNKVFTYNGLLSINTQSGSRNTDGKLSLWTQLQFTNQICPPVKHIGNASQGIYTIQRFTGLIDDNGKEIYEGDLILTTEIDEPRKVKFEDGCFGIYHDEFSFEPLRDSTSCCQQVVGNVFENP